MPDDITEIASQAAKASGDGRFQNAQQLFKEACDKFDVCQVSEAFVKAFAVEAARAVECSYKRLNQLFQDITTITAGLIPVQQIEQTFASEGGGLQLVPNQYDERHRFSMLSITHG